MVRVYGTWLCVGCLFGVAAAQPPAKVTKGDQAKPNLYAEEDAKMDAAYEKEMKEFLAEPIPARPRAAADPFPNRDLFGVKPPRIGSQVNLDLNRAALAQMDQQNDMIILSTPIMKTVQRTREVPVTRIRKEKRMRRVPAGKPLSQKADGATSENNQDGAEPRMVDQTYEVNVPYTEMVTQKYTVTVPGELRPTTVDLSDVQAWTPDGLKLKEDALKKILTSPRPVLPLRSAWPEGFRLNKAQLRSLSSETLFLRIQARVNW